MSSESLYQIVPSEECYSCDVCCRFLEEDSPLAPIFTSEEQAHLNSHGVDLSLFESQEDGKSSQVNLKPYQDYFICPFFETETSKCSIYTYRPLDCQLYPFAIMYNEDKSRVLLGVDMLCPYSEAYFETDVFQNHLQSIIDYVESDDVRKIIETHWSLIGEHQDTVRVFHTISQDGLYGSATSDVG